LATSFWMRSEWDTMRELLAHAIEHARRMGNRSIEIEAMVSVLAATMFGSTPATDGTRVSQEILDNAFDSRELQGWAVRTAGTFLALEGRFDEARERLARARAIFTELGNNAALVGITFSAGPLEVWSGDPVAAERELRRGLELAQRIGDRGRVPNLAALLASALLDQGSTDDAEQYVNLARDEAHASDSSAQALWRIAAARLLVRRGATEDAVTLTGESVAALRETQELFTLSHLLIDVGEVLQLAGRPDDATEALRDAVRVSQQKGATALVRLANARLEQLARSRS